jgi:hypothetical protein
VAITAQTIDFEVMKQEVLANEATFEGANAPTAEKNGEEGTGMDFFGRNQPDLIFYAVFL